jgi:nicotinate-nucleotide adenylyltransferase
MKELLSKEGLTMKNIGIFGGTFNPIHVGHLIVAQEVADSMELDKIIFIPTGDPPHKNKQELAVAEHRYEMVRLAIKGNEKFDLSDIEIKRSGKTYTFDTLVELNKKYKDHNFYFIIGFDTLKDIDSWKKIDEVFKISKFIVVNRGNLRSEMEDEINDKKLKYEADIKLVTIPDIQISSTDIRKKIKSGKSIKYLVLDDVYNYIMKNKLYRGEQNEGL